MSSTSSSRRDIRRIASSSLIAPLAPKETVVLMEALNVSSLLLYILYAATTLLFSFLFMRLPFSHACLSKISMKGRIFRNVLVKFRMDVIQFLRQLFQIPLMLPFPPEGHSENKDHCPLNQIVKGYISEPNTL